ncbi:TIGR03086 family metal-binding protein [Actinokineospora globicatena]|uniref:TIGR03086 family metal-binding protein n=1 Tax=Actinokineospora globicatena TaxID=103729 RepID=UPI0020A5E571|nr:TIGR03086 family metal-binding protein [Actinokineospora globicatena]MCP2300667.1 TIGR03086 family protein [Actinokineospora globicatena]GLW81211.1 TIGR03086 family protein [Actinokineospora globicatena]GLW88404.1 TIGR03086 family protein [Actinokineospora globicatena]
MDVRDLDRRAIEATGRIVDTLTDEQLAAPTPCPRWQVRDVVAHMADNKRRLLTALTGSAPEPGDDVRGDFRIAATALTAAFTEDSLLTASYELLGIEYNAAVALFVHFADTLVHGWDIGTAIGQDVRLPEDLVQAALKGISRWPDDGTIWGKDGLFGEKLPVAEDATPQEKLLATTGRSPQWTPASTS